MGFMGIGHWEESDNASGFLYTLTEIDFTKKKLVKQKVRDLIDKELKNEANNWNTPGYLNIALVMEVEGAEWEDAGYCLPKFSHLLTTAQLKTISSRLGETAKEWEGKRLRELKKMVDNLIESRKRK